MKEVFDKETEGEGLLGILAVSLLVPAVFTFFGGLIFVFVPERFELQSLIIIVGVGLVGFMLGAFHSKRQKREFLRNAIRRGISLSVAQSYLKQYDPDLPPESQQPNLTQVTPDD